MMQESRNSHSVGPEPLWLQGCTGWAAGSSPSQPAKLRDREILRAQGQQKLPHKSGFCPFALSLSGDLRGTCHGAAPTVGSIMVELGSSCGMSPPPSPPAPGLLVSAGQAVRPHSHPVSDMGVITGEWVLGPPSRVLGGL